jgi:hypothetical protein
MIAPSVPSMRNQADWNFRPPWWLWLMLITPRSFVAVVQEDRGAGLRQPGRARVVQ